MDLNDYPPPPAYHFPYTGPGVMEALPLARVNAICRLMGVRARAGEIVYACSVWLPGGCLEIISDIPDKAKLIEIEDANCNGWPKGNRR